MFIILPITSHGILPAMKQLEKLRNNPLPLIIISMGIFVGLFACFYLITRNKSSSGGSNGVVSERVITIAKRKNVDPCRLLDPTIVATVFGQLPPTTEIESEFLEKSVTKKDISRVFSPSCTYSYNDSSKTQLKVQTEVYASPAQAQDSWNMAKSVYSGASSAQLSAQEADLRAVVASPTEPEEKKIIAQKGLELINQLQTTASTLMHQVTLDGLDKTILFDPEHGLFTGVVGSDKLELSYRQNYQPVFQGVTTPTAEQRQLVTKVNEAFRILRQRVNSSENLSLPVSAVPSKAHSIGSSNLQEPCSVLSYTSAKELLGYAPILLTTQTSTPLDPSIQKSNSSKSNLIGNSCTRHIIDQKNAFGNKVNGWANLAIEYAPTDTIAKTRYKERSEGLPSLKVAGTDEAAIRESKYQQVAVARKGSTLYLLYVSLEALGPDRSTTQEKLSHSTLSTQFAKMLQQ